MKNILRIALVSASAIMSLSAQAMPLAPIAGEANVAITQIAYGCGPGMTRGPYGRCRPMFTCPAAGIRVPTGFDAIATDGETGAAS